MVTINYNKMPASGYVLAYFRNCIVFEEYSDTAQLENILNDNQQLLELHAFDESKEYRLVFKDNKDALEQVIEDEAGRDTKIELVKVEESLLSVMSTLKVVNYIDYDENGMIAINNYRLAPGKGGNN